MIAYHHQGEFRLGDQPKYTEWILRSLAAFNAEAGDLNYIFCTDLYLQELNKKYLGKDYLTDTITFEYDGPPRIGGDVYISVERVNENARDYGVPFEEELRRVMIHGLLHMLGYQDKEPEKAQEMRQKETELMAMFHVKQS